MLSTLRGSGLGVVGMRGSRLWFVSLGLGSGSLGGVEVGA